MDFALFAEQILNGLQAGVTLFLTAAGLTLVFGIVGFINLNHGTLVMAGAYIAAKIATVTGSFWLGLAVAVPSVVLFGLLLETSVFRRLYHRDHLDQVLATFSLILFFNELARIVFGRLPYQIDKPALLAGSVHLFGDLYYPIYRLAVIGVGVAVATGLWYLTAKTKLGMLIRAGSTHRNLVGALGVNVGRLFLAIFALGALLAGLAGAIIGPMQAVEVGMGENIVILALVVIVIGGVGSIRGALVASIFVGVAESLGRTLVPYLFEKVVDTSTVTFLSGMFASTSAYVILAAVLIVRPQGLFAGKV